MGEGMDHEPFSSDLTDEQWERIATLIPTPKRGGRRRTLEMREVVNAIRFLLKSKCGWRDLPGRFPNRSSVRHYYDRWRRDGTWGQIQRALCDSSA